MSSIPLHRAKAEWGALCSPFLPPEHKRAKEDRSKVREDWSREKGRKLEALLEIYCDIHCRRRTDGALSNASGWNGNRAPVKYN